MRVSPILTLLLFTPQIFAWTLVGDGVKGWAKRELSIYVNPSQCGVGDTTLYDAIDSAIASWNNIPTADLLLVRVQAASTTSITTFTDGQAPDVPLFLCSTSFTSDARTDADVVLASTMKLSTDAKGALDYGGILLNAESGKEGNIANLSKSVLALTLAHELGHVLGLGHSSDSSSLMYFSIAGKSTPLLTQDDIDGFSFLYPRDELQNGAFGCAAPNRGAVATGQGTLFWFLILVWLTLFVRFFKRLRRLF